jgi:hypothetical protein
MEVVWGERRQLLDDIRRLAGGLGDLADSAVARLPPVEPAQLGGETVGGGEAGDGAKSPPTVTEESAHAAAAVEPPPVGLDENDSKGTPAGLA